MRLDRKQDPSSADRQMYYYKYCSPGDRQFGMLSRGEIFFASAAELNDGSECRPRYVLRGAPELWYRLCDLILLEAMLLHIDGASLSREDFAEIVDLAEPLAERIRRSASRKDLDFGELWPLVREHLPPLLPDTPLPKVSPPLLMDRVRQFIEGNLRRLLDENTYMSCFSRDPRDPTMWGHYAGADRGFCIVIRATEDKLQLNSPIRIFLGSRPGFADGITELGIYNDAEAEIAPVLYRSAPMRFNAFHRLIPHFRYSEAEEHYDVPLLLDAPSRQESTFGLVKALTWKYEQEVRALLPSHDDLTPEARCIQLKADHFQGLVFGPKMSLKDKRRAVVACHILSADQAESRGDDRPFIFFNAAQQVDSFRVRISPVGVLGRFYSRRHLPFESLSDTDERTNSYTEQIFREMRGTWP